MTFLNREQAAAYLGFKPCTLAKWASQGIGPAYYRRGRGTAYRQKDLDDWQEEHQRVSPTKEGMQ